MARQKGLLIPRLKKGLHPDVVAAALRMLITDEYVQYAEENRDRMLDQFVREYDDEHGVPVWYIP